MDTNSEYYQQLQVINQMLAQCSEGTERDELNSLKQNIEELLELTRQPTTSTSLEESTLANTQINQSNDDMDDEYARFMSEIESTENEQRSNLKDLEGKKFRAPHEHRWGQLAYHNAMVCSVPENIPDINELEVKVLFLNPTHKEMLPCPYYFNLEKECHFTDEQCRFSHGEPVPYSSLQDYVEPKFEKLTVGSDVLAKQSDDLWYRAKIRHISKEKCLVEFDSKNTHEEIIFAHIFPLEHSGNTTDDHSGSDVEVLEIGDEDNGNSKKQEALINKSLLLAPDVVALGDWEKYTKGIGSKLMQKMGYIVGTGLGKEGSGIIKPVTAVILPQGKSLDFCMNLKEKANNPQLFHADNPRKKKIKSKRQLKKERRKANKAERKLLEIEQLELNDYIRYYFERSKQVIEGREGNVLREKLAVAATKDVNVANFIIDERVKLMTTATGELKISIQRLEEQHLETKALYRKLKQRNNDLKRLNIFGLLVQNELDRRKNNKKMVVF